MKLHPDRLLPASRSVRDIARDLYREVADLPIISPHGHTDSRWFADDAPFPNATELLLTPDHYLFRMLFSQGVKLEVLGVPRADGSCASFDPREAWRTFASHATNREMRVRVYAGGQVGTEPQRTWSSTCRRFLCGCRAH